MNRAAMLGVCLLIVVLSVAACSDDATDSGSTGSTSAFPRPTIPPMPNVTVLPGCNAAELETWYEITDAQIIQFVIESRAGLDRAPNEIADLLNRLYALSYHFQTQNPPECAAQAHSAIIVRFDGVIDAYTAYAEGTLDQDELRARVETLTLELDTEVNALMAETRQRLEARRRIETETAPSPTPPP